MSVWGGETDLLETVGGRIRVTGQLSQDLAVQLVLELWVTLAAGEDVLGSRDVGVQGESGERSAHEQLHILQ